MKPTIKIKYKNFQNGELQSVELFKYSSGLVLHHHLVTMDIKKVELYPIVRKIGKLNYCTQEIALTNTQWIDLLNSMKEINH